VFLTRFVVPLWLFTGAVLKLMDMSPTHLPAAIIKWVGGIGLDLAFVVRFTVAVELIVAAVMVLLPPIARWVGIAMLGAFIPVLVGDIALGASSCGCFGALQVNPWITMVMDVTFFLGILILGRREPRLALTATLPTWNVVAAGLWSIAAVALAFGIGMGTAAKAGAVGDGDSDGAGSVSLPADGYYLPQYDAWIGQPFRDLEIASWIMGLPEEIDTGQQFVIFYRKDCEHCHELMEVFFSGSLEYPTTAVAVPERDGYPTENIQPLACTECRAAELPAGVDWFLQTPVLVRLMDGYVECAAEVDSSAPDCIGW
jgi:hypothetical protein